MNAVEQIKRSLGIKDDVAELVIVVAVGDNVVEAHGGGGKIINLPGNWQVGTKLIVKSSVVQSVVADSGVLVYGD